MPFLSGLFNKVLGMQPGQGFGDRLGAAAAFGQGAMGGRGLLGALGGGMQGAQQWQRQNPWAPPSAPTMRPFTPAQLPGQLPVPMPQGNPGITQMPMQPMQPGGFGSMPGGYGMMPQQPWGPQAQNLGFNGGWRI